MKETLRSADRREREPESRGGAAVHPDGAEADPVRTNRADAVGKDSRSSAPARRYALRIPCCKGDSDRRLLPDSASSLTESERKSAEEEGDHPERSGAVGCGAGLGLGLWRGGCLQTELIHFHLQRKLKRSSARMQTKADSTGTVQAEQGEPEPAAEAASVTQQDQALEEEMESLLEENEDLKV